MCAVGLSFKIQCDGGKVYLRIQFKLHIKKRWYLSLSIIERELQGLHLLFEADKSHTLSPDGTVSKQNLLANTPVKPATR